MQWLNRILFIEVWKSTFDQSDRLTVSRDSLRRTAERKINIIIKIKCYKNRLILLTQNPSLRQGSAKFFPRVPSRFRVPRKFWKIVPFQFRVPQNFWKFVPFRVPRNLCSVPVPCSAKILDICSVPVPVPRNMCPVPRSGKIEFSFS